jgi:hypothetical protein
VFPVLSPRKLCMMKCAKSAFHHAFFVGCGSEFRRQKALSRLTSFNPRSATAFSFRPVLPNR